MTDHYINLFTDFGFKKIFGEEASKEHLISFLNTLLPERHQIQDLQFCNTENQGASALDRKAIFDLNCRSASGEYFVVELQKAKQNFFKDRSVFYATFPIQQQAQRGEWDFRLAAVYTIGILDFIFDDEDGAERGEVIHRVQLKNQHHQVFYDKLTFIYLTLPNFTKSAEQLETLQEKWFFLFRHLHELDEIPPRLREQVFLGLFEKASIARFKPEERQAYESSLKYYRDLKNVIDTARDEGREEGREQGRQEGREEGREQGRQEGREEGRQEGREEGREQGRQEGREEGREAGIKEGADQAKRATALKLMTLGVFSDAQLADATGLAQDEIQRLRETHPPDRG